MKVFPWTVAEITAVPAATATISPSSTVATDGLEDFQVTLWLHPSISSSSSSSTSSSREVSESFGSSTVTLHFLVCLFALTVIVAVPALSAVSFPLDTFTTELLLLFQTTFPFAFFTLRVVVCPFRRKTEVLLILIFGWDFFLVAAKALSGEVIKAKLLIYSVVVRITIKNLLKYDFI